MSCNHCTATVTKALLSVHGVTSAVVDLASLSALVTGQPILAELPHKFSDPSRKLAMSYLHPWDANEWI